jgi:transketolase
MGDLQGIAISEGLYRVPVRAFESVIAVQHSAPARARAFAALARINTLYMIARAGSGHIGSSFSSLDIVTWLHLTELNRTGGAPDIYFSSKGHDAPGLYSVLIGLGALDENKLETLRRLNGLPGHPDIGTAPMPFNTGSLGMGVSKAKGLMEADRVAGTSRRVYVMTGDGELQEGQFWESLAGAANRNHAALTVIVDHNKFQSDRSVATTSDLGALHEKVAAFNWHVERCDGHDFTALSAALDAARAETARPSLIIADTVKGRGVDFMEHTAMDAAEEFYRFHSGAPSAPDYARAVGLLLAEAQEALTAIGLSGPDITPCSLEDASAAMASERLIPAYSEALIDVAESHPDIVALDADLILDTGLIPFRDRFPDRFFECGIAEQDMVSQAGGMARQGLLPFVHSFACFLSTRPNEQIYNNASERSKVVYAAFLAGLLPAGPGHSHQSVRDIAALKGTPGLDLIQPGCAAELTAAVRWIANESRDSAYLRICSIPYAANILLPPDYEFTRGRGSVLADGNDAVLIAYGPIMLNQALAARAILDAEGVKLRIANLPWLNRLDDGWLGRITAGMTRVFTLDDHYREGGQGEMIAARMAEAGTPVPVTRFGLDSLPLCGRNDEVLAAHGLDAATLATRIREILGA